MQRRLIGILIGLIVVFLSGVFGYVILEGWSLLDSFYMTIITLASVGYMEVHTLTAAGRVFTIILILCGSGILIYGLSVITAFIVEGELTDILRRRRMSQKIERLSGHFIVCGTGRTGKYVIDELLKTKRSFVVIERDPDKIRVMVERDILCIEDNATHDSVLLAAGVERARGLITALHTDAENLLVVITARRLNPALRIISKAVEEESDQKLKLAGADGVVMPNFIGGLRMVSEMVRPSVVTFLDVMLRVKDRTVRVEELGISSSSPFAGKSIEASGLHEIEGVSLVALKRKDGERYIFNPGKQTVLREEDALIVMGDVEVIEGMRKKTSGGA